MLRFKFDGHGCWRAWSDIDGASIPLEWRITVTAEGMFSLQESDPELPRTVPLFATFAQAVDYCNEKEPK